MPPMLKYSGSLCVATPIDSLAIHIRNSNS